MVYTMVSEKEILQWLKSHLSDERFFHTLGTAKKSKELARRFNLNEEKAYIAGLLHDCAKCFDNKTLLKIIKENLDVQECELMNHKTLHAPVSAHIAKTEFKINDEEILSAIRWHTLGKMEMTTFEKIIFLADKIEPNTRDKEYIEKVERLLDEENGLDKAILKCYKETIKSLVKRDLKICHLTIDIYNKLESILN